MLDERSFPSDPNGALGQLRKELTNSLNKARFSSTSFALLEETLKAATKLLKDVKKQAAGRAEKLAEEAKAVAEAEKKAVAKAKAIEAAKAKFEKEDVHQEV